jgi:hypothetical protein
MGVWIVPQVRWARVVYASFADYTADAEWLVTRPPDAAFDYVEGFAFVNSDDPVNGYPLVPFPGGAGFDPSLLPTGAGPVLYCLEVALYQHHRPDDDDKVLFCLACGGRRRVCVLSFVSPTGFCDELGGPRACPSTSSRALRQHVRPRRDRIRASFFVRPHGAEQTAHLAFPVPFVVFIHCSSSSRRTRRRRR